MALCVTNLICPRKRFVRSTRRMESRKTPAAEHKAPEQKALQQQLRVHRQLDREKAVRLAEMLPRNPMRANRQGTTRRWYGSLLQINHFSRCASRPESRITLLLKWCRT